MNVIIAHYRPDIVSGAEFAIADMIRHSLAAFSFIMLVPKEGRLAEYYRQKGFEVWVKKIPTRRRLYPGWHFSNSLLTAYQFRKRSVDAVLCNTFAATGRVRTACRIAGVPYVIYVREYFSDKRAHSKFLKDATLIFAVSEDIKRHIENIYGKSRKTFVVYDFLEHQSILQRVNTYRSKGQYSLPYEQDTPVVGYVGRITRYKRPDLFIRAIPHVLEQIPKARFVVVGKASELEADFENSLKDLAESLGISQDVAFLGHRQDAVEIISDLTALCLPSKREPFPRVILEAQLIGTPVVVSASGGCVEMVTDGVDGLYFTAEGPGNEIDLANQLIRLISDPGLRKQLSERAKEKTLRIDASLQRIRRFEEHLAQLDQI